jgi:hypothetical protein
MRRAFAVLACVGSISAVACSGGKWTPFQAPDGSFEVHFPGTPTVKNEPVGPGVSYLAKKSDVVFGVGVKPLSAQDAAVPVETLLAAVDKDMAPPAARGLMPVTAGSGQPGREYTIDKETGRGPTEQTYRLYFHGGKVYTLIVIAAAGNDVSADRNRFFSSFKLRAS